jgi:hypothetical protein
MQHVGEPGGPEMKRNDKPVGGLSPAKAFFALLALLVAIGGLFLLTRPNEEPGPGPAPKSDNFALTDAEAIERFTQLTGLALESVRERDPSLLNQVFTSTGPVKDRASREIRSLLRDNVIDQTTVQILARSVVTNDESVITVRERSRLLPCFVTEDGRDVTRSHKVVERVVVWTLQPEGSVWRIHDSELVTDQFIRGQQSDCP